MNIDDKNSVYTECDNLGESAVRAKVDAGHFGVNASLPLQWLNEKSEERLRVREAEDRIRNERALAAAEMSAASSERAALSAKVSARWTMLAALIALLSIVVQQLFK